MLEEHVLGKTDATFTLYFSTGSSTVLMRYQNLIRYGRPGGTYSMRNMQEIARVLADKLEALSRFDIIGREDQLLPTVTLRLAGEQNYDEFDIAWQLLAERGWMVRACTLPPDTRDVTIMRALARARMSRAYVASLVRTIEDACATLARMGEPATMGVGPGH